MKCTLCPRGCGVDRAVVQGFCRAGREPEIAAVCAHRGEEPPISGRRGICNVFFAHCNLQCVYCQNWQITRETEAGLTHSSVSRADSSPNLGEQPEIQLAPDPAEDNATNRASHSSPKLGEVPEGRRSVLIDRIASVLQETENILGFVTPTHYADSIPPIVEELHRRGMHPVTVYNSSGYETVETLRMLEPYIDVYLPDFKYADPGIAARYSHAPDYPERALAALREMYRQKGSSLITEPLPGADGEEEIAVSGIIVRHLVLPGCVDNSIKVLDAIADLSMNLHVSLMAQYYPPRPGLPDQLNRTLKADEYDTVVNHFHATGLHNGWLQELSAQTTFRPDFSSSTPFSS
ncbi:MAG: hypothetical protein J6W95_04445 [Bacteroidales bacterium]|nr:hypothetical protein [Bacteroidales bacterium]